MDMPYIVCLAPEGWVKKQEGENIIYTGKDLFWGHLGSANTYNTLDDWVKKVKVWHNGASVLNQRIYPSTGLE